MGVISWILYSLSPCIDVVARISTPPGLYNYLLVFLTVYISLFGLVRCRIAIGFIMQIPLLGLHLTSICPISAGSKGLSDAASLDLVRYTIVGRVVSYTCVCIHGRLPLWLCVFYPMPVWSIYIFIGLVYMNHRTTGLSAWPIYLDYAIFSISVL